MKGKTPNQQEEQEVPAKYRRLWPTAPSLKPGKAAIEAHVDGHPYARAITAHWQFRAPVKRLSADEYKRLIERCTINFGK